MAVFAALIGLDHVLVDRAPKSVKDKAHDRWLFLAAGAILMLVGLVYPAIRTARSWPSRMRPGQPNGFDNFVWMFTQPEALITLRNTVIWTVLVPLLSTVFGLAYAVFIDRARGEKHLQGAGVHADGHLVRRRRHHLEARLRLPRPRHRTDRRPQRSSCCLGMDPKQFLLDAPENTIFLIIVMVWIQTGFAMVMLSAAIKGVPMELVEAAASGWRQRLAAVPERDHSRDPRALWWSC